MKAARTRSKKSVSDSGVTEGSEQVRIGIVSPSAPIGLIELERGVSRLEAQGWSVRVHPQARLKHIFYAGSDEKRAQAILDFAYDSEIDLIWAARGGYGAIRVVKLLDEFTRKHGVPPQKRFFGYSDATLLLDFLRRRWGWEVVHSPMPGTGEFSRIPPKAWSEICSVVERRPRLRFNARWLSQAPSRPIIAPLVGGNLAVWTSAIGTPWQCDARGSILFLEELTEPPYRMDRLMQQLDASGGLRGVKAIVLGTFTECEDSVVQVLADRSPKPKTQPLRPKVPHSRVLREVFVQVAQAHGIPIACGLPVGHGGGFSPLPLGLRYRLGPEGSLELLV